MSIVMGLDPAAGFGWAAYDSDRPPSSIESDSLKLEGGHIVEKLTDLRLRLVPLLREYKPAFIGIEAPFSFLPKHPVKAANDMLSPLEHAQQGQPVRYVEESTITISKAGQMAGAATALCLAWNIRCMQMQPNQWQTIIPATIKSQFTGPGAPKKRAKAYCDALRINSPNIDSRDAALIALWTAGHAQELKLLQMAGAA
jgi:Holliday junction resolvasome RuvABC endonuclease subunit